MQTTIKLVGIDPAIRNMGLAFGAFDVHSRKLEIHDLRLVQTENDAGKKVRKSSDDLRRAKELFIGMRDACEEASIAIAEVPSGTQSARGMMSNGICIGLLAAVPIPLIEVNPGEVKLAACGVRTATKEEMIEWAMNAYPHLPWLTRKLKGAVVPIADNEHLADACAILHAGIQTEQFKQATAMLRVLRAA